jgi:hypothetical protein
MASGVAPCAYEAAGAMQRMGRLLRTRTYHSTSYLTEEPSWVSLPSCTASYSTSIRSNDSVISSIAISVGAAFKLACESVATRVPCRIQL